MLRVTLNPQLSPRPGLGAGPSYGSFVKAPIIPIAGRATGALPTLPTDAKDVVDMKSWIVGREQDIAVAGQEWRGIVISASQIAQGIASRSTGNGGYASEAWGQGQVSLSLLRLAAQDLLQAEVLLNQFVILGEWVVGMTPNVSSIQSWNSGFDTMLGLLTQLTTTRFALAQAQAVAAGGGGTSQQLTAVQAQLSASQAQVTDLQKQVTQLQAELKIANAAAAAAAAVCVKQ